VSTPERIRITHDEVFSPKVDEVLAREGSFGMRPGQMAALAGAKQTTSFFYSSIFYTAVAGALGACLGWMIIEPFINDALEDSHSGVFSGFMGSVLMLAVIIAPGALFIGAVEGLVGRNWSRALTGGAIGLGIGFGSMIIIGIVIQILYGLLCMLTVESTGTDLKRPITYILLTLCRAIAWAPMGVAIGVGPAIAMRSGKLAFNGIIGGLLGAFTGGLLFNPIESVFKSPDEDCWLSRGVGFTLIGLGAGAMIGLVENLAKTAWLHVQAGALAGKQFILYKSPTVLGSSPKCEIYLFKDAAIEPKHAAIHAYGNRHEIEDLDSPAGTFVNGQRVTRQPLKNGDRIYLGETVLDFSEKESD